MKEEKKIPIIVKTLLILFALGFVFQGFLRSCGGKNEGSKKMPDSYSSIMEPSDVNQYKTVPIEVYHVEKVTTTQVDLVAQPHKNWQGIIRFNPSQTPPIMAKFEKVDNGVYSTGVLKLTLNTHGGYDYVYLEEGKDPMNGVLRPNWY